MSHTIVSYSQVDLSSSHRDAPPKVIYVPLLDTKLCYQGRQTIFSFSSLVDSGADFCVFPAKFGRLIGLPIEEGEAIITSGIGGKEILYFHKVQVGVVIREQIWKFECEAGFSFKMNAKGIGFLGRKGFFDLFEEVAFNQQKRMVKLKGEGARNLCD